MTKASFTLPNGTTIDYELEHRPRRTIGLKITEAGLVVHAPKRLFAFELNQVLMQKAQWIINKLEARKNSALPPLQWADGETLQLHGQAITLKLVWHAKNKAISLVNHALVVQSPAINDANLVKNKVVQWYKKQALLDFERRLAVFATKLGLPMPVFGLSSARARWGSCSSRGSIRLNWRLLQAPPDIINYVICHELAHLKEMNHSAQFWLVVKHLFPAYKQAEKNLKALSTSLHRL